LTIDKKNTACMLIVLLVLVFWLLTYTKQSCYFITQSDKTVEVFQKSTTNNTINLFEYKL
jgi:hypothetical protein